MSIDIDCVDWHTANDETMTIFQQRLPHAIRVNSVGQMVNLIEGRLGTNGRLRRLRIFGHGTEGAQGLGNSHNLYATNLYNQITLHTGSQVEYANVLGRLRGRFEHGWVELHGCSVGGGASGWNLLKALARLWQVNVAAGTVTQYTSAGFEVQYRVAEPSGRVHTRHGHAPPPDNTELVNAERIGLLILLGPFLSMSFHMGEIARRTS